MLKQIEKDMMQALKNKEKEKPSEKLVLGPQSDNGLLG